MTTIENPRKKLLNSTFASTQFWLCNISGWLVFDLAQSVRDSFDGSPLIVNLLKYAPTSILGMLAGLCVHLLYKKMQWYKRHPMRLIPIAGLIAIVFACINIFINIFDLVLALPETCSRQYPHSPNSCGVVSDLFLQSLGVMLVWCLFYFLIQAERKTRQDVIFCIADVIKAIITLIILKHLGTLLSVIAYVDWGNTYYLFSKNYFIDSLIGVVLTIIFSSYILFIKHEKKIFGSRILPLIPTLFVMTFCFAILNIGAEGAFSRLYHLQTNGHSTLYNYTYYVFFGSNYGNFNSKSLLAGMLQGGFIDNLLFALFFLSFRHSSEWKIIPTHNPSRTGIHSTLIFWSYNFLFWLSFGLLIYATDLMEVSSLGESTPLTSTISFVGIGIFIGAVLRSQIEYFVSAKTLPITLGLKIFIASLIMGALLTSTLWLINYAYILVVLDGHQIEKYTRFVRNDNYVFASILASCVLCGLWSFICYMIESQHLQRDATIKQLQIEMNMKEVQLNALAGKIDPHFVFNALNNIRALVDEDTEKARSAIVVLSDILRSPITNNSQSRIPIAEEMLLVRNFISLSKIQLEDCLVYMEDVSENVNTALIPAMMLQILVENAIKHGISQLPDGGVLSLHVRKVEQQLICTVINNGSLLLNSSTSGFGVGISAIQARLALLYNNNASFSLQQVNDTVVAELVFPFESSL